MSPNAPARDQITRRPADRQGMPRTGLESRLAVTGLLLATSAAFAQSGPELRRVDPGIGDVDPQQISLRSFEIDLRQPLGFDLVYEGMRHDPFAGPFDRGERYLTRSSGAINAVFPRSSYVPTQSGYVPEIPAGTIFYIGDPAESLRGPGADVPRSNRSPTQTSTQGGVQSHAFNRASGTQFRTAPIGRRRDLSVRAPQSHQPVQNRRNEQPTIQLDPPTRVETRLAESLTIWSNEAYRQRRVTHLLESAEESERPSEAPRTPDASPASSEDEPAATTPTEGD